MRWKNNLYNNKILLFCLLLLPLLSSFTNASVTHRPSSLSSLSPLSAPPPPAPSSSSSSSVSPVSSHRVSRITPPSSSSSPKSILYNSTTDSSIISQDNNTTNRTEQIQLCLDCVHFMDTNLNTLVEIVEKIGVIDTCEKLCGMLNSSLDVHLCTDMCDAIGIQSFWQLFVKVDINPIYACELVNACVAGKSPAVTFTGSSITPPSGPPGTTFELKMQFTVVNETGVGETAFVIYYPSATDYSIGYISSSVFPDYEPGDYQANLTFPTNSSFMAGKYLIIFDLCSGACGMDPNMYPFATEEVTFNITNLGF